ncbi:MAG: hypothetical protein JXR37_25695 [Kiritimatiellae bacterium]|nr:hypothetical protein [Kiritimatiellia bacterium]
MDVQPQPLGLKRSFGFGDRLGLATPGHLDAVRGSSFAPILAQQSIRELARTGRQPADVMTAAKRAVQAEGWAGEWGADADHLQTREDVSRMAAAGFCFFTIDPSAHVNSAVDHLGAPALAAAYDALVRKETIKRDAARNLYMGKRFDVGAGQQVVFDREQDLTKAVVKYGAALAYTAEMAGWIADACAGRPYEIEMSVDETLSPTSPLEHLFVGMELKRLGVNVISLALRFVGDFEKGVDYRGELALFEQHYRQHVAIADACGPYKLSIHSGSDKFSIYPVVGRLSGDRLHVKTAGTSYLEALRVVCRTDVALFRELVAFCRAHYDKDRATYHVSAALGDVPENVADADLEDAYLNRDAGRQILHVTYGSVLVGGQSPSGRPFREAILENLEANAGLYREVLHTHLGKHLAALENG